MPRCTVCRKEKPLEAFRYREDRPKHYHSACRECEAVKQRAGIRTARGRYTTARAIARQREIPFDIPEAAYAALRVSPCHYCGAPLNETGIGLDRLDHAGSYTTGNVVPCCDICNRARSNVFTSEEMLLIGTAIREVRAARDTPLPRSAYGRGRRRVYE